MSNSAQYREIAALLNLGKIIVFPTDTVYGLASSAHNKQAIKNIYKIKNRSFKKPLILQVYDKKEILKWVKNISEIEKKIMDIFWPGPLTMIFNAKKDIEFLTIDKTIAFRIPDNIVALNILKTYGKALATTSANISEKSSLSNFNSFSEDLINNNLIDLFIDGGCCKYSKESTIIDARILPVKIIREGVISKRILEKKGIDIA